MNDPAASPKPWYEGNLYLASELANRFGVPKEEIAAFQPFIRVYPAGSVLIQEEELDKSLFLVRFGAVGVYKNVAGQEARIGSIEAVNFVGEMSLLNDERRSATIKALSEQVLAYCFARPNLSLILSNPKWAELLVTRLAKNLAQSNKGLADAHQKAGWQAADLSALQAELEQLKADQQQAQGRVEQALGAILYFQNTTRAKAVVGSKGWAYLAALTELSQALIAHYLPGMQISSSAADRKVMQKCLEDVRKTSPAGIFDDFEI